MDFSEIKTILKDAAQKADIRHFDVYYVTNKSVSAETLKSEISSFSSETSIGICFRCLVDGHFGYASSEKISETELRLLVSRAMNNARYTETEEDAILFEGADSYQEVQNEMLPMPSTSELCDLALKMQKATYEQSQYVSDGTQSSVGASQITVDLFNSYGLSLHKDASVYSAVVSAVVSKDGGSEDDYDYTFGKNFKGAAGLSDKVVASALSKLGAEEIDSGIYDIVISGKQMSVLLNTFSGIFSAKSVKLGLSLLAGKEGEKIAADSITLVDDPYAENLVAKTPFDAEGVPTKTKTVIKDGVLQTLLYDLETAKAMGKQTTANASKSGYSSPVVISPYYFGIEPGSVSFDELIARVKNGIYVTELKGLHAGANAVTGDFSIESAGYRIENGKIGGAVKSFTIAGNFYDLLKNADALSDHVTVGVPGVFSAFGSPDVLLRKVSIAGK